MTHISDSDDPTTSSNVVAGRYRLIEPIARGGMGAVWLAHDDRLKRRVAVKQLRASPGSSLTDTNDARARMYREARLAAQVRHPNVVTVLDLVDHAGPPCLILEYLPAQTLSGLIAERGPLEPTFVAALGVQIADALSAAHDSGIVHCDVKPPNILISDADVAKLSDFGIARSSNPAGTAPSDVVIGTPAYLPPETARGEPPTAAADVFSLGATLYAAVEGHPPYGSTDDATSHIRAAAMGATLAPTRAGPLTPLLERALAADAADRPTMEVLSQELKAALGEPSRSPQRDPDVTSPSDLHRPLLTSEISKKRRTPAVAVAAAVALALTMLVVAARETWWGGEELSAAATMSPSSTPETGRPPVPVFPVEPDVAAIEPDVAAIEPDVAAIEPASVQPAASDVPIEWSAAGQLVIDYYAGAEKADGWTLLNPDVRHEFGSSDHFRRYWNQYSRVWAQNAHGVTVNDDGSVNVPVDVTYVVDNKQLNKNRVVQVSRQDGRLVIATEAR